MFYLIILRVPSYNGTYVHENKMKEIDCKTERFKLQFFPRNIKDNISVLSIMNREGERVNDSSRPADRLIAKLRDWNTEQLAYRKIQWRNQDFFEGGPKPCGKGIFFGRGPKPGGNIFEKQGTCHCMNMHVYFLICVIFI